MTVLAGTPLEVAQATADDAGLVLPLDIGARGSCTIGGNLATNAGGNRVICYGPARDQVLGLEAVLPDGSVVSAMNMLVKNNTGYDVKHLLIGSEGTLGIITKAVLRLRPRPTTVATGLCALPSPSDLTNLLAALRARLGPSLSAFEAMWPDFWTLVTSRMSHRSPFAEHHGAYALIEMSGFDPGRDEERLQAALTDLLETGTLADAVIAQTGRETADFWKMRESVGDLRSLLGPLTSFDVGIPAQCAEEFVASATAAVRERWPDAIQLSYGHLGDNNIHIVVHIPSAGQSQPKHAIDDIVYEVVGKFGGSISAEHGIGLTKRVYLPISRTPEEIAMMRLIKAALDPKGIMNPGKILDRGASR
jgi:FAD/FMN-containing dehydrogenase